MFVNNFIAKSIIQFKKSIIFTSNYQKIFIHLKTTFIMDKKTMAIVSYITIIGWLISFFSYKDKEKDSLVSYHLKQAFGLFVTMFCINIAINILTRILVMISPTVAVTIAYLGTLISLVYLILLIIGIITANKGEEKPLPIIGKMFEGKFDFIP